MKPTVVALVNQKGGVGKSVSTVNLGVGLAQQGKKVLVVDNNPQSNCGQAIPGVAFSLINAATGEVVETVTSDENGMFVFTQFDYGDWIVHEEAAPEGFNRMEDVYPVPISISELCPGRRPSP